MKNGETSRAVRALLIAGPTGSGKSALALRLAARLDGALIVNCDSMQVYDDLCVLTARPGIEELSQGDHALYGHRDGGVPYSVAQWRDEVRHLIDYNPRRPMIFVGGTGLYFQVLTKGISPVPPVDEVVRRQVRQRMDAVGSAAMHGELDEQMAAQLRPGDSQRVARALEVLISTGRSLSYWQALPPDGGLLDPAPACRVVMNPARDWLEERIAARAAMMLEPAGLDEVATLRGRGLHHEMPVMRAIGVSLLGAYLE